MIVFHLFFIKLLIGTVLHLTAPRTLFPEACSTLLYSSDGQLLGARIAPDGQWRFPPADSLPGKFVTCLLTYEDKRFFRHPGVDPVAIVRAMRINLSRGKVVSGGSTITMQLARIARGNRDRTLYEKNGRNRLCPSPGNSLRQTSDPELLCLARPRSEGMW